MRNYLTSSVDEPKYQPRSITNKLDFYVWTHNFSQPCFSERQHNNEHSAFIIFLQWCSDERSDFIQWVADPFLWFTIAALYSQRFKVIWHCEWYLTNSLVNNSTNDVDLTRDSWRFYTTSKPSISVFSCIRVSMSLLRRKRVSFFQCCWYFWKFASLPLLWFSS